MGLHTYCLGHLPLLGPFRGLAAPLIIRWPLTLPLPRRTVLLAPSGLEILFLPQMPPAMLLRTLRVTLLPSQASV